MTATTTAQAAQRANVTPATIRAWARYGAVAAAKSRGRWAIDEASLTRRIALGRKTVAAQLAAFTDAGSAQAKAEELLELGALVMLNNPYTYLAVSPKGTGGYVVNMIEGSCTCNGHVYTGHCYHYVAAAMLDAA
jgi:hypothetical protein